MVHPILWALFCVMNAITLAVFEVRFKYELVNNKIDFDYFGVRLDSSSVVLRIQIMFKCSQQKDEDHFKERVRSHERWRKRRQRERCKRQGQRKRQRRKR